MWTTSFTSQRVKHWIPNTVFYHWCQSNLLLLPHLLIFFLIHLSFSHSVRRSFPSSMYFLIACSLYLSPTLKQSPVIDILARVSTVAMFLTSYSLCNKRFFYIIVVLAKIWDISSYCAEMRFTILMFVSTDLSQLIIRCVVWLADYWKILNSLYQLLPTKAVRPISLVCTVHPSVAGVTWAMLTILRKH